MKITFLLFTLMISSCALVDDFQKTEFNWLGDPNHPSYKKLRKKEAEATPVAVTPTEYKEVKTKAINGEAELIIGKTGQNIFVVKIQKISGPLSYKEGHSIDIKLDDVPTIQKVNPTKPEEPTTLEFSGPENFISQLENKKTLKVELLLNSKKENYEFNISEFKKP